MNDLPLVPLISADDIRRRVGELASDLARDYAGRDLVLIGALTGAFVFLADLVRALDRDCEIRFLSAASYGPGRVSSGVVRLAEEDRLDARGRHVVLVDDILDTGLTIEAMVAAVGRQAPASLAVCVLLEKRGRRRTTIDARYVGFTIPDEFVVGYGMDLDGRYRNLPYIARLPE